MIIGFTIWSIVAIIFLGIGISSRKSREAAGFFTFVNPPDVQEVEQYNKAVSILWFAAAGVLELIGIPILFLQQNSPLYILIIFAVVLLVIIMMLAYFKIGMKYRK